MPDRDSQDNLGQMYGVGIMAFVLFLSTLVGLPVLPALSRELGANTTQAAFVVSAALMTVVAVQFFAGVLADRYSRRRLVLAGALIGSVSSLLCVVANHWIQLAALRIAGGIADAVTMPALLAITASLGKDTPGKFFGILRASQGLSFAAGPALGAAFSLISLRAPFVVDGILSLLAFLAALKLVTGEEKAASEHSFSALISIQQVFSSARTYLFLLMGISGLFAFGVLYTFIPIKAEAAGLMAWQIGTILTAGALSFSAVSLIIGTVSDRFGRKPFVVVSQIIIAVGCLGAVYSSSFVPLLLSYCFFCVGEATTYLLSFVYASEGFPKDRIGTSMGAFDSVMDLALLLAPILAMAVHRSLGSLSIALLLGAAPAVCAVLPLSLGLSRGRKCKAGVGEVNRSKASAGN